MKLSIISGSQRLDSQSAKVASALQKCIAGQGIFSETTVLNLAETPLPLLDFKPSREQEEFIGSVREQLTDSDAFVIISPEWHGMATAAIKNFFLHFSGGELAHKPALLVSVSAGMGGAYPIAELRSSSYKNSRICYIPEQLIIRHVESVFNSDEKDNDPESQKYLGERMNYATAVLASYSEAMKTMRDKLPDGKEFANGM